MSADNLIYVKQEGGRFYVWHAFFSDENTGIPKDAESFADKASALERAKAMDSEYLGTEYGVELIGES